MQANYLSNIQEVRTMGFDNFTRALKSDLGSKHSEAQRQKRIQKTLYSKPRTQGVSKKQIREELMAQSRVREETEGERGPTRRKLSGDIIRFNQRKNIGFLSSQYKDERTKSKARDPLTGFHSELRFDRLEPLPYEPAKSAMKLNQSTEINESSVEPFEPAVMPSRHHEEGKRDEGGLIIS